MNNEFNMDFVRPLVGNKPIAPGRKPFHFDAFYPRRYRVPKGWYDPRIYALLCSDVIQKVQLKQIEIGEALSWELASDVVMLTNRIPTWFVGEELLESLGSTRPPNTMLVNDIKWPTDAFLFILPIEVSDKLFGRHVPYLSITRGKPAKYSFPRLGPIGGGITIETHPDFHSWLCVKVPTFNFDSPDDPGSGTLTMRIPFNDQTTFEKLETKSWGEITPDYGGVVVENDEQVLNLGVSIAIQLLLLIGMAQQASVTPERVLIPARTLGKGPTKQVLEPTLWSPRWVGEHYKKPVKPPQGGHHKSPIMHLRLGHWRAQHFGPRELNQTRQTWIEPVWVNVEPSL